MNPQPIHIFIYMFDLERRVFDSEFRPWEIDLTRLRPLDNRVVIERIEDDNAIVLTDKIPAHRGRVIATGPGSRRKDGSLIPITVKVGDIVAYMSCDVDSGTHVLLREPDILFIEIK